MAPADSHVRHLELHRTARIGWLFGVMIDLSAEPAISV